MPGSDLGSYSTKTAPVPPLSFIIIRLALVTPPIVWEAAQYAWVQQNPEKAALVIGEQLAAGMLADMLNVAVSGAAAAISGVPELCTTVSAALSFNDLVTGAGKFGDRMGSIAAWVMHSKSMTDLYSKAVTNAENLFTYDTVSVLGDPFGRRLVMTDSESLVDDSGTPKKFKVLGLVAGAGVVEQNSDFRANVQTSNGKENIQDSYQAEWSYNLGLLGYSWNVTSGGKAPTNAAIGTAASWDKTASSNKDTAGVLITAQ